MILLCTIIYDLNKNRCCSDVIVRGWNRRYYPVLQAQFPPNAMFIELAWEGADENPSMLAIWYPKELQHFKYFT